MSGPQQPPRPDPRIAERLRQAARADEVVSRLSPWLLDEGRWWQDDGPLGAWPPALTAGVIEARRGYRFRPENVAVAALLASLGAVATRICDLGAGSGSLLLTACLLGGAVVERAVAVEVQPEAAERLERTLAAHELTERAAVVCGDLRRSEVCAEVIAQLGGQRAGLVLTNPPWFPASWGRASGEPAVHASTHALAGGVEAFLDAAAQVIAPQGRCLLVYDAERLAEALVAAGNAGFVLERVVWLPDRRAGRTTQPTRVWLELASLAAGTAGARVERLPSA